MVDHSTRYGDEARHIISMRHCHAKEKSGAAAWKDPDDAPEWADAFFDRAEIRHRDKVIRRGRPPLDTPKQAVKLRLDADVLAAYRKTGEG